MYIYIHSVDGSLSFPPLLLPLLMVGWAEWTATAIKVVSHKMSVDTVVVGTMVRLYLSASPSIDALASFAIIIIIKMRKKGSKVTR